MQVKFYIFSFQMSKIFKKFQPLIEVGITRYLTVVFSPLCAIISPAFDMLHICNNGIGTSMALALPQKKSPAFSTLSTWQYANYDAKFTTYAVLRHSIIFTSFLSTSCLFYGILDN